MGIHKSWIIQTSEIAHMYMCDALSATAQTVVDIDSERVEVVNCFT